jgi:colanic acid biosynthesis glycosyl transferase WcaI
MVERSTGKGVRAGSTIFFPNWVDTDLIRPLGEPNIYRQELKISDEMVVALYSGNMGNKQGLEILAEVARSLRHEQGICFIYCGNGSGRNALMTACEALENVRFMDLQPLNRLNELLNLADIHLLPQRADAADLVMPSKLTGMLASSKAIVATAHEGTELATVVRKCGLIVPREHPDEFSEAVLKLAREPHLRKVLGRYGRKLAVRDMSKEVVLSRFLENVQSCLDESSKPTH